MFNILNMEPCFEHYRSIRRFDSPTQVPQTWGNGDCGSVRIERKILIRINLLTVFSRWVSSWRPVRSFPAFLWLLESPPPQLSSGRTWGCWWCPDRLPGTGIGAQHLGMGALCILCNKRGKIMEKFRPMSTRRALLLFKDALLRTRRASMLFKDDPLRTRRVLSLYKAYNDSALLVLNGTSLNSINDLLALSKQFPFFFFLGGGGEFLKLTQPQSS